MSSKIGKKSRNNENSDDSGGSTYSDFSRKKKRDCGKKAKSKTKDKKKKNFKKSK